MSLRKPYVDSYNLTNDTCPYGSVLGSTFKGIGDICPPGHFCKQGSIEPTACEKGTYNNGSGKAECNICPPGYYCPIGTRFYESYPCPAGHYCLSNTTFDKQYPCPEGTFNNLTKQKQSNSCLTCPPGSFCAGVGNPYPTGQCSKGWYCLGGTTTSKPTIKGGECKVGTYCPAGSSKPTPCSFGKYCSIDQLESPDGNCSAGYYCLQNSTNPAPTGTNGDECPRGYYCPSGTMNPVPCPAGKYLDSKKGEAESNCKSCTRGYFCNASGLAAPIGKCSAGYYCPEGQHSPTAFECWVGHYCLEGVGSPQPCSSGKYQDVKAQDSCKICLERYFCNATSGPVISYNSSICPAGYFCPNGTQFSTQYPCAKGTFNNVTGRKNQGECSPCLGGYACDSDGLVNPVTPCAQGYFCKSGARSSTPEDGVNANVCPLGHYCPQQTTEPFKCKQGTLGKKEKLFSQSECSICPAGLYCPTPGTYNQSLPCQQGFYCPNGSVIANQVKCPAGSYCPQASAEPLLCPVGTFSNQTMIYLQNQCTNCTAGWFCDEAGLVYPKGLCQAGFYCPEGSKVSNPSPCPIGLQCPQGKFKLC